MRAWSTSKSTTAVSLPLDYYETGSTPTYLLMPRIRTSDSGTKSVSYYGPAESDRRKRPVLKVTYSLRENFDEKVGFISRTDGGVTRYLCLNENNSLAVSTTPYRWIFEEYLTGYGDYVIRSFEDSDYCLKAGANNTVTAVTYPVLPEEPSTEHFWTPILHNSALDSYLFYSNAGGGFLHLNTADCTLTLSGSSGIDEHAWRLEDSVSLIEISSLDVGNFTFVNLGTNAHLAVGQSEEQTVPVRLTGAPESYNATWIPVRLEDGCYRFRTQTDSGKLLKADGTVLTVGTETDDSTKWTVKTEEQSGGYYLKNNSTGTVLADRNGALCLVTEPELANRTHLWKTEDFFALRAEPEDRVEFALHHLQSGKYPEYESVFGSGSSGALTVEEFNAVVDETVADSSQSYGYTAQTRAVCQRFTFEKMGTGDNAYYHILPYLRLRSESADGETTEINGSYRSEYRLAVVNGAVKVMQTAEGEDPASGRWILQKTAGGKYRIFNAAANKALTVENNTLTLTSGTAHILWELKAISLAMEKDYQQYRDTCGAASGRMVVNYLIGSSLNDNDFLNRFLSFYDVYDYELEHITTIVNDYIYTDDESDQYSYTNSFETSYNLQNKLSVSLNKQYPVIVNIKPLETYEAQAKAFGYCYSEDGGGHYFVVKGLYYNNKEQRYDSVINETHYKFGATPSGKYNDPNNPHIIVPDTNENNIGGRDTVVSYDMLYTVYTQRYKHIMYME